jgi:hypothetical protein
LEHFGSRLPRAEKDQLQSFEAEHKSFFMTRGRRLSYLAPANVKWKFAKQTIAVLANGRGKPEKSQTQITSKRNATKVAVAGH